jgi:hypothetical protein
MPADRLPPVAVPEVRATVVWSRHPQPGQDAIVYFNHYTYNPTLHRQVAPQALRILYMYEPVAVDPIQYSRRVWRQFDARLTWNTYLTESSKAFRFDPGIYYDLPYTSRYGVHALPETLPDPAARERAICQICGDKYSLVPEELYSVRRRIAAWFHRHAATRMDVFGIPPTNVPNYRGTCDNKAETFARYRYSLCFENTHHPLWSKGYITEKLLDCMYSLTVPVYLGASDIEHLVPPECFIDYRRFTSLEALDAHLQALTDAEYLDHARHIQSFLRTYDAPRRHSVQRLYESVAALCREPRQSFTDADLPPDYLAHANWSGKGRFYITRAVLPHHRFIYHLFGLARRLRFLAPGG